MLDPYFVLLSGKHGSIEGSYFPLKPQGKNIFLSLELHG